MPKDTSRALPPKPVVNLDAAIARREPQLLRLLPQAVFDRIQHGRDTKKPYRYTTKDVNAIVHYVSGAGTKGDPSDPRTHRWPTQQQYDQQRAAARSLAERISKERQKALAERIEPRRPPLIERIQAEYIKPKPVLSDFDKLTPDELNRIFTPRITATSFRLRPIAELLHHAKNQSHRELVRKLIEKFDVINQVTDVTHDQWRSLELGLKAIGRVEFKGLRRNFDKIIEGLAAVYVEGHFDWIRV